MKFNGAASGRLLSWVISLLILTTSIVARANDPVKKPDTPKPEPARKADSLKEKEDPALIGKRNINKGNLDFYSFDKEAALGRQLASEVDSRSKFVTDPIVTEYVNRLGQNLVLHSDAKVPFTIKVLDSADVNAFALPGGFLYVNSGLLLAAENESEVAGVMAHEIAHVAARHGVEQASKGHLMQWLSIPLIFVGGPVGAIVQNAANILVPLSYLKFSRGAEEEADRLGLQYMWASGYDPTSMLSFFEKLRAREKRRPGTLEKLFSTHPATGERIQKARALLVRFPDRDEYLLSTSEFNLVQGRLTATVNQTRLLNGEGTGPTLKRKPVNIDDADDAPKGKPTLKRKPDSGN